MPFLNINNINLHYRVQGKGEPLLFLHGLGSCCDDWQEQVDHFSKRYQVITVDSRGHGRSDKPDSDYSIPLFASDIRGLLAHLKVDQIGLIGFSMGGMIAFQLAVDIPSRIKSLIIINSAPAVPYSSLIEKLTMWQRLLTIKVLGMKTLGRMIAKQLFPQPQQKHLYRRFSQRMQKNSKPAYVRALKSFIGWDVRADLNALTMPVLIVAADHDYTPVAAKQAYQKLIATSRLVIITDSRHATPVDQPEQLNNKISQFLNTLD